MKKPEKQTKLLKQFFRLAVAVFLIASCASPSARRITGTNNTIPDDCVVLVGKFVIVPPPEGYARQASVYMENGYIHIDPGGRSDLGGQFHMYLDKIMRPSTERSEKEYRGWSGDMRLMAFENETFCVILKRMKYFGIAASYFAERNGEAEFIYVPASFPIDVRDDDRAIYIGTIKYTRDEYYDWKDLKVIDEYNQALPAFRQKFGSSIRLRKALTAWLGN